MRKYELTVIVEADDFQSMLNLFHATFQDIAAGTINAQSLGTTADYRISIAGPMAEYHPEYLSYRDAADEEAR